MTAGISGTSALLSSLAGTSPVDAASSDTVDASLSTQVETAAAGTQSDSGDQPAQQQGDGLSGLSALFAAFSAASGQGSSTTQATQASAAHAATARPDLYNGFLVGSDVASSATAGSIPAGSTNSASASQTGDFANYLISLEGSGSSTESSANSSSQINADVASSLLETGTAANGTSSTGTSTQASSNGTTTAAGTSVQAWQIMASLTKQFL